MPGNTPDGLKQEIDQGRLRTGNQVQLQSGLPAAVSAPLSSDSSGNLSTALPLPFVALSTTAAILDITGTTSLSSGGGTMTQTLVSASGATTVTSAGFVRVNITDAGGNITNGGFYLQVYTIV